MFTLNRLAASSDDFRHEGKCIFAGLPDFNLDSLQQVMKGAARVISRRRKYDHISDNLQDLHWLRVPQRKLYLTVYKALHNFAPSYLAELCITVTAVLARQRLRFSSAGNVVVPNPRTEFGKRSLSFPEPHAWNKLQSIVNLYKHRYRDRLGLYSD